jgi:hypothetical protein
MVYKNKLIAAIQVNGKTLREKGDIVELPFKSEYSIFLKNLETRRCKIDITIDGTNVTGSGLVLNSLTSLDLERFIDDNRKFKFISKSKEIEDFRGNKPEDGIIEIKYGFELKTLIQDFPVIHHYHPQRWSQPYYPQNVPSPRPGEITYTSQINNCSIKSVRCNSNAKSFNLDSISSDNDGITVKGSESNQQFTTVSDFNTGNEETIIFKLIGSNEIITTKSKKQCSSCGFKVKSKHNHCPKCGTYVS